MHQFSRALSRNVIRGRHLYKIYRYIFMHCCSFAHFGNLRRWLPEITTLGGFTECDLSLSRIVVQCFLNRWKPNRSEWVFFDMRNWQFEKKTINWLSSFAKRAQSRGDKQCSRSGFCYSFSFLDLIDDLRQRFVHLVCDKCALYCLSMFPASN